ncbi:MAG: VWA domain-containing protein [Candidatus Cloacimonetes bacterium]|nr:VWA domain-containing protein [Candidatus Cloacimonadota bacterium]
MIFEFVYPYLLWLLFIIPFLWLYELFIKNKKRVRISYSRLDILKETARHNSFLSYIPLIIRSLMITALIFALAQPRLKDRQEIIRGRGIDIMLSIDVSGSMQALDFKPKNRLEAAKRVALDFIDQRVNDRIGVVVFAPHAFTLCPLTNDYNLLRHIIENIDFPEDASGTAIGMGIATAVARLKDSDAESKVIVLITDGVNNSGEIDPITAAHLAATFDIKIYAVGIGSHGLVDFPFHHPIYGTQYRRVQIDYDMNTLHQIARITGVDGAWEATDTNEFARVLREIDALEQTEYEIEHYYRYTEIFYWLLLVALILLFLEYIYRTLLQIDFP